MRRDHSTDRIMTKRWTTGANGPSVSCRCASVAGRLIVIAILAAPARLPAQSSRIDERVVDSIVADGMKRERLVGLSIALVRGGRIELAKGYGAASLQPRTLVDTGIRFSVGSVTKEFVTSLALLLQEDGKLSVHDTLARWYPKLTRSREITLLDLINHVSGYRDYYPLDYVDREMAKPVTAEQIMKEYATVPLDFDPGTRWSYSNTGYTILGRVLERVGGKPLGVQLEERIFRPLGMSQTMFEPTRTERRANGYVSWALGEMEPALLESAGWHLVHRVGHRAMGPRVDATGFSLPCVA